MGWADCVPLAGCWARVIQFNPRWYGCSCGRSSPCGQPAALRSTLCLLQRKLKAQRRELQSLAQIQAEVEEEEAEKEAARLRRKVGALLAGAGLSSVGACRGDGPVICCLPARSRHRLGGQARVLQEDGSQRGTDRTAAVCSACLRLVHPYHSVAAAPSSRPASLLSAA